MIYFCFRVSKLFFRYILFIFLLSCTNERSIINTGDLVYKKKLNLKYAKQFNVQYTDSTKTVTITQPWSGSKKQFTYYLSVNPSATTIKTPVNTVVCLSPPPLAMLNLLGLTDKVIAVGSKTEMYNNDFYKKFKTIGKKTGENNIAQHFEALIELSPELIFESATGSAYDDFDKLEELKLKTALFSAHTEPHPLGRLEWIKYIATFFDQEKEAETIFNKLEQRYYAVQKKSSPHLSQPKVFVGYPWKDSWVIPGGNSYMAKFIADAGGAYIYAADTNSGNVHINFEKVIEVLPECDIWLNPGIGVLGIEDIEKIPVIGKSSTSKLKIYNNNKRLNDSGKNDFWESGIINPDLILKDLIKICHPQLFTAHELYYFRLIK